MLRIFPAAALLIALLSTSAARADSPEVVPLRPSGPASPAHAAVSSDFPAGSAPAVTDFPVTALAAAPGAAGRASAAEPGAAGLYPLQLPDGQRGFADKLAEQLRDGATGLPGQRGFALVPRGACLADEAMCLALLARRAGLGAMVAGRVMQTERGFTFELHLYGAADGRERASQRGAVEGGPLDLAGGLEHGLCALLGGGSCEGALRVSGVGRAREHLFVDGQDRGELPLSAPLSLPVGRHLVRAGSDERRLRIAYGRETQLFCAERAGALELLDRAPVETLVATAPLAGRPSAPALALNEPALTVVSPRRRAAWLSLAAGAGLLMTAGGLELYARSEGAVLARRAAASPPPPTPPATATCTRRASRPCWSARAARAPSRWAVCSG